MPPPAPVAVDHPQGEPAISLLRELALREATHPVSRSGLAYEYGGYAQPIAQATDAPEAPTDGVVVDGVYVSNLFVYDARGNPLHDVQIVDDRGRPVRTVPDGSGSVWSLPGVAEAWQFAPAVDASGRDRWNVYPLLGAPGDEWTWDQASGAPVLVPGASLRQPPAPLGAAEALSGSGGAVVAAPSPATSRRDDLPSTSDP